MSTHRSAGGPPVRVFPMWLLLVALIGLAVVTGVLLFATGRHHDASAAGPASTPAAVISVQPSQTISAPPLPTTAPATARPHTSTPARPAATVTPKIKRTTPTGTNYTVRPGDNLTVIARWFHIQNLRAFYTANLRTVGPDWNLLQPGQHLHLTIGM